jgi:streptomycin 6-kinase
MLSPCEPSNKKIYPTYESWVNEKLEDVRGRKDYKAIYEKMLKFEQTHLYLCNKYTGEMLLHGDLYHNNILLGENYNYRIIDPIGAVGDVVFDISLFMVSEVYDKCGDNLKKHFNCMIRLISDKLDIPEYDLRCLFYIGLCMSDNWNFESPCGTYH